MSDPKSEIFVSNTKELPKQRKTSRRLNKSTDTSGYGEFFYAMRKQDVTQIKEFLDKGLTFEHLWERHGFTIFTLVTRYNLNDENTREIFYLMLQKLHVSINHRYTKGFETLLHVINDVTIIRDLLNRKDICTNVRNFKGMTPLLKHYYENRPEICQEIIGNNVSSILYNVFMYDDEYIEKIRRDSRLAYQKLAQQNVIAETVKGRKFIFNEKWEALLISLKDYRWKDAFVVELWTQNVFNDMLKNDTFSTENKKSFGDFLDKFLDVLTLYYNHDLVLFRIMYLIIKNKQFVTDEMFSHLFKKVSLSFIVYLFYAKMSKKDFELFIELYTTYGSHLLHVEDLTHVFYYFGDFPLLRKLIHHTRKESLDKMRIIDSPWVYTIASLKKPDFNKILSFCQDLPPYSFRLYFDIHYIGRFYTLPPELVEFYSRRETNGAVGEIMREVYGRKPKSLLEMSRDTARSHFARIFNINWNSELYSKLSSMELPSICKSLLLLEYPIYPQIPSSTKLSDFILV